MICHRYNYIFRFFDLPILLTILLINSDERDPNAENYSRSDHSQENTEFVRVVDEHKWITSWDILTWKLSAGWRFAIYSIKILKENV